MRINGKKCQYHKVLTRLTKLHDSISLRLVLEIVVIFLCESKLLISF